MLIVPTIEEVIFPINSVNCFQYRLFNIKTVKNKKKVFVYGPFFAALLFIMAIKPYLNDSIQFIHCWIENNKPFNNQFLTLIKSYL